MNFVPYLTIRNSLPKTSLPAGKFKKIISPIILLPVTYLVAGGAILTIKKILGWIPK